MGGGRGENRTPPTTDCLGTGGERCRAFDNQRTHQDKVKASREAKDELTKAKRASETKAHNAWKANQNKKFV